MTILDPDDTKPFDIRRERREQGRWWKEQRKRGDYIPRAWVKEWRFTTVKRFNRLTFWS